MTKKKEEVVEIELGEPLEEIVSFLNEHYSGVEKEGRPVKGLDRLKALKGAMDKAKAEQAKAEQAKAEQAKAEQAKK